VNIVLIFFSCATSYGKLKIVIISHHHLNTYARSIAFYQSIPNLQSNMQHDITNFSYIFYRAMLRRARYCHGKLSVRPSVRLSVCLCDVEIPWLYRLKFLENYLPLISIIFHFSEEPNITNVLQREHPIF